MVCESGEVDVDDVDAVGDEVDSNPEGSDDDDKNGAFAAARDGEEGESEIIPFIISFCGEGEDVDEKTWLAPPEGG